MKVTTLAPGVNVYWTDRDHFIHGNNWYRVVEVYTSGRVKGEFYWRDSETNEVWQSTVLTETGFIQERPI